MNAVTLAKIVKRNVSAMPQRFLLSQIGALCLQYDRFMVPDSVVSQSYLALLKTGKKPRNMLSGLKHPIFYLKSLYESIKYSSINYVF